MNAFVFFSSMQLFCLWEKNKPLDIRVENIAHKQLFIKLLLPCTEYLVSPVYLFFSTLLVPNFKGLMGYY